MMVDLMGCDYCRIHPAWLEWKIFPAPYLQIFKRAKPSGSSGENPAN